MQNYHKNFAGFHVNFDEFKDEPRDASGDEGCVSLYFDRSDKKLKVNFLFELKAEVSYTESIPATKPF